VELRSTPAPTLKQMALTQTQPKPAQAPVQAPPKTLLYIEDNPANMKLVERLMDRRPDIVLLTAVDGTLGIALARAALPDVILMDIHLPGISGIDALKALREDPSTAHIPVIALSANAMLRDIEMGQQLGFFRYLTKPIVVEDFMRTLDLALDTAAVASAASSAARDPQHFG
jgi:CheY-like chemotaxis protein